MILDTSFLIDVLRGTDAVTDWEDQLDAQGGGMVTPISVMELWEGIHLTDARSEERTRVKQLIEGLNHAAFDQKSAMIAGEYSARLTAKGTEIEIEDIIR